MSKRWIPLALLCVVSIATAPTWAGYDFEPPSLRSFMRYWGIGPGPGYHAVPCMPRARLHYRCVTRGFSPEPVESDYYPDTKSAISSLHQVGSDPFLPYEDPRSAEPLPPPQPLPQTEVVPPPGPEMPAPLKFPTPSPELPTTPVPRRFPIETRQQDTAPKETPVHTLLDELLREQEIKLREVDEMLKELGPPPLQETPAEKPAKPISTAGDNWW